MNKMGGNTNSKKKRYYKSRSNSNNRKYTYSNNRKRKSVNKKNNSIIKDFSSEQIVLPKQKDNEIKEKLETDNIGELNNKEIVDKTKEKDIDNIGAKIVNVEIIDQQGNVGNQIENKKKYDAFIVFILLVIILIGIIIILKMSGKESLLITNKVSVVQIEVVNYNKDSNIVELVITPNKNEEYCALGDNKKSLSYTKLVDNKCHIETTMDNHIIYFKDNNNMVSDAIKIDNYVVDYGIKDENYLAVGSTMDIVSNMVVVGKPKIKIEVNNDILEFDNNKVVGINNGTSKVQYVVNGIVAKEVNIIVTNLIASMPKEFDTSKPYLTCKVYTQDEAAMLDKILESRIADAGYGTRAGAVAAARFLTLEFPYKISYFWENGRLSGTGTHIVDGEGRYYHKGLYLDESKVAGLKEGAKLTGPAIWGCDLKNYETDPPYFVSGRKYPNGLDCSGFVSWSLYNGGLDVGDIGAGDLPSDGQLTDVGDFRVLTDELIASGKIKVGDLFNIFGHISILVGEDEENYYIAESLNTYRGVVLRKYAKTKVGNYFTHVVLMEGVYKGDGNLTNLWY